MNKKIIAAAALAVMITFTATAQAYILELTNGGLPISWNLARNDAQVNGGAVVYHLNSNCSADFALKADCLNALRASFNNWTNVVYSKIAFAEGATTTTSVAANDGVNNIFFVTNDPELGTGVVGLTTTYFNPTTGEIIDSDIRFNDASAYNQGGTTTFLESVATHEIGHMVGLDHSFLGYVGTTLDPSIVATMYPLAITNDQWTLQWDDMAGASAIYPEPSFATTYGVVTGHVDSASGPILGAHVTILDTATGAPILGAMSDDFGNYTMQGAPPKPYVALCEEPLDPAYLGWYYANAQTGYSPVLYLNHPITSFNQATPGDPAFDGAERVIVMAATTTPNIDFTVDYAAPPPPTTTPTTLPPTGVPAGNMIGSSVHHSGGGGCVAAPGGGASLPWIMLLLFPAVRMLVRKRT